jgi:ferrochelatase
MKSINHDAVLLISFGGPEKLEDTRPFLETVARGRQIPSDRIAEVAHHYERIGGYSPINAITFRQAEGLRAALAKTDTPRPVYVGNRNWHPFLEDTLKKMIRDGVKHAVGFVTAPFRSEASLERYSLAVEEARTQIGPEAPVIDYVGPWFDHPLFIEAIACRIQEALEKVPTGERASMPWVFTAHSIPCAMAEESTYLRELRTTADLAAKKLGKAEWSLAFTSRSGSPDEPWLEPDICDVIRDFSRKGVNSMLVIPIGFIADHVEVLFDLDVEARQVAVDGKVNFYRAQTVGEHPLFIQMIADVVRKAASKIPA